ncbi:hypothetical protein L195_g063168, partial [Trifolium pratense]
VQAADVARLARPGRSQPARESSHKSDDREATGGATGAATGAAKGGKIEGGATDENLVALRAHSALTPRSSNHAR